MDYLLHDQPVRFLKGKLRLRQVTRLCDGGHQTQVITSRWDLRYIEAAYRMFERWRQENFFKYMREEFLLDALTAAGRGVADYNKGSRPSSRETRRDEFAHPSPLIGGPFLLRLLL